MTVECVKCGQFICEAYRLNGTMDRECACGAKNHIAGTVSADRVLLSVTADIAVVDDG